MSWLPVVVRTYVHTTPPVSPVVQLSAWNTGLPSIETSAVSTKVHSPLSSSLLKRAKPVTVKPAAPLNVWSMTVGTPAAPDVSFAYLVPPPDRTCPGVIVDNTKSGTVHQVNPCSKLGFFGPAMGGGGAAPTGSVANIIAASAASNRTGASLMCPLLFGGD